MKRADLVSYLQRDDLVTLAREAGQTYFGDNDEGWRPAVTDALRALGVAEDSLDLDPLALDDSLGGDARVLTRFYALESIYTRLASAVDLQFDQPAMAKKRSQLFSQVGKLLERAQADIAARGYNTLAPKMQIGRLQQDYIAPAYPDFWY